MVILTARDEKRGTEAVENLKACGLSDIFFHQLDVTDSASIAYLADYIKNKFGKLNILVNNAGVNGVIMDAESFTSLKLKFGEAEMAKKVIKQTYETAEGRLRTNYYRHKQLSQALIPLLRLSGSARIVNVLSSLGQLKDAKEDLLKAGLFSLLVLSPKQLLMATQDMSFNSGHYTDEQGAKGPVKLVLTVGDAPSGLFFFQREKTTF
ncbi:(+)-neomenthol dehydrogenase-like [Camellia sinensis]|uniref:(+)-neomenthol dehydrogenase-like n=1 Tax=Camellia sinensis TaxID=4442 RepID=UPI001036D4DE|nr:(+)-neomenthol dehydrogenase-like [Camellia sinensis]